MTEKIVQIIPVPEGTYAKYRDSDNPNEYSYWKIVCLALTSDGDVLFMDTDSRGMIEPVTLDAEIVFNKKDDLI